MMKTRATVLLCSAMLLIFPGCNNKPDSRPLPNEEQSKGRDKIYKGTLNVGADKGIASIINQEVEIFRNDHDSVITNLSFADEGELLNSFRNGNTSTIIIGRVLDDKEIANFKKDTIYIRQLPLAFDAAALIGNKKFIDKNLDLNALKSFLSPAKNKEVKIVFDKQNKSLINHVLKTLGSSNDLSAQIYAVENSEDVVKYVEAHDDVIGFVPFNMLSDTEDNTVRAILKRVKILSLRSKDQNGKEVRVSANQSDIATGEYPLIRTLNAVTRFTYTDGLDWLLINFMYQSRGAKIFLKAGLIPAKMPEREIIVNTEDLKSN